MKKNELIVRKSNDMISNFANDLNNNMEMDLFDYMIANINSPQYDKDFHLLEFNVVDFYKDSYGKTPGGVDYKAFKKAVEDLASRQHWGIVKDGKYKNHETIMRLIDKPYLNHETGRVILKLDDNLKPYLLDFANKPHTRFLYLTKASLPTGYSKRLYEILKSKENLAFGIWPSGENYITIDDFKKIMSIPDSYKHANIKKRILIPAQIEIENKTDIKFSYREIKQGKGVLGYQFKIFKQEDKSDKAPPAPKQKKKNNKPPIPDETAKDYPDYIVELTRVVESSDVDVLLASIDEYLFILHDNVDDTKKQVYIKSLISKVRRAKNVKTTKLAYCEGIVRNELDKLKASKVSSGEKKPIREEIVPEWLEENKREWAEKHKRDEEEQNQKTLLKKAYDFYKKKGNTDGMQEKSLAYKELTGQTIEEEEAEFKKRVEELEKELKSNYGKPNND